MRLPLIALLLIVLLRSPLMAEDDILARFKAYPSSVWVATDDGRGVRQVKYGDQRLEQAEVFLTGRYPRPWTLSKTMAWFQEATDHDTKACLLRVLAASRDPKAALIVGDCLRSKFLFDDALEDMYDYFVKPPRPEDEDRYIGRHLTKITLEWFAANKDRLQREAR